MRLTEASSFFSQSPEETEALGHRIARELIPGTIVGFEGNLGAGKTTLIQAICQGLGVKEHVLSPTFVIMHVYQGTKFPVYHFDLYRLSHKEINDLGWEDYLFDQGISLIEWIDRAPPINVPYIKIKIDYGDEPNSRKFEIERIPSKN